MTREKNVIEFHDESDKFSFHKTECVDGGKDEETCEGAKLIQHNTTQ
jgi:hypothetical protein